MNKEEANVMDNYEVYDLAKPVDLDAIGEPVVGDVKEDDVSMTKKPGQLFKKRGAGVKKNKRKHKKVKHKKARKSVKKNKKRQTRK